VDDVASMPSEAGGEPATDVAPERGADLDGGAGVLRSGAVVCCAAMVPALARGAGAPFCLTT
jgi:hypothetical protein